MVIHTGQSHGGIFVERTQLFFRYTFIVQCHCHHLQLLFPHSILVGHHTVVGTEYFPGDLKFCLLHMGSQVRLCYLTSCVNRSNNVCACMCV
jgi:hypothetical protein